VQREKTLTQSRSLPSWQGVARANSTAIFASFNKTISNRRCHFELFETLANPYGIIGRARLR